MKLTEVQNKILKAFQNEFINNCGNLISLDKLSMVTNIPCEQLNNEIEKLQRVIYIEKITAKLTVKSSVLNIKIFKRAGKIKYKLIILPVPIEISDDDITIVDPLESVEKIGTTSKPTPEVLQMSKIMQDELDTFVIKNQKYGNSFDKSVEKYGLISALTRMSDKWNRLETLILNRENGNDTDESLLDTLKDLANYSNMTIKFLEHEKSKK